MSKVEKVIKRWMRENKLTYRQAEDRLGVSYAHICNIQNGRRGLSVGTAKRIAKVIGCTWPELCE